jgi:hypothetical protein
MVGWRVNTKFRNDVQGTGRGLIEALSRYLPGQTEDHYEYIPMRIIDVTGEIRTTHIHSISEKRYGLIQLGRAN